MVNALTNNKELVCVAYQGVPGAPSQGTPDAARAGANGRRRQAPDGARRGEGAEG